MKEIYNEGRVVGLSAYEIYVRHSLSEFPDEPILSEREWIAATLGDGVSMILRIAKGTSAGVHDFQLPVNSKLCAAKTITASMFNGEVKLNGCWAKSVTSYGTLIEHPESQQKGQELDKPTSSELSNWDAQKLHMFREYMKLTDGVAYQPRLWEETYYTSEGQKVTQAIPANKYLPDLSKPGVVRIRLAEAITEDLNILLSGFFHRPIVAGVSMFDSNPLDSPKPQNGDFLGVEIYPWASKIIMTVPSEAYYNVSMKPYERELPDDKNRKYISQKPIVDYDSTDPGSYYKNKYEESTISVDVKDINVIGSGVSVIGTYQRVDRPSGRYTGTNYPPALYGARITSTGENQMSPIDIVAPGSIKMFEDKDLAINYPKVYPNIYALHETQSGDVYIMRESSTNENIVPITTKVKVENFGDSTSPKYAVTTQARGVGTTTSAASISAVSLLDLNGNKLNTDGSGGTIIAPEDRNSSGQTGYGFNYLNWTTLLRSLGKNEKIELLGSRLKEFRSNLPSIVSGEGGILTIKGEGPSSIAGSLSIAKATSVGGALTVNGATTLKSTLSVSGATTVGGDLTVKGTGESSIAGSLKITKATSVGGALSVTGSATIGGKIDVNGTGISTIGGSLTIGDADGGVGDLTTEGKLTVKGTSASTIGGRLIVKGTGQSTIAGSLSVTGATTIGNKLKVDNYGDGENEFTGDLIVGTSRNSGPNLIVNHGTTMGGNLYVGGKYIGLHNYSDTEGIKPHLEYISGSRKDPKKSDKTLNFQLIAASVGLKSGKNFIEFTNGEDGKDSLRLYIAPSAPSLDNVPIGSIGIGW